MIYTDIEPAKFVLRYAGCNNDYVKFGIKVRREMGQRAKAPRLESIRYWTIIRFILLLFLIIKR